MLLDSSEQELLLEAYFILLSLSRENVRVKCSAKRSVVPSEADNIQGRASQGWRGTRFQFPERCSRVASRAQRAHPKETPDLLSPYLDKSIPYGQ